MTLASQWTLKLPASEAVHHIMTFDPSDRNFLYLMTTHHVRTLLPASTRWGLLILVDSLIYSCQHGGRIIMATIRLHSQLVELPYLNLAKHLQIFGKDPHVSRSSIVSSAAFWNCHDRMWLHLLALSLVHCKKAPDCELAVQEPMAWHAHWWEEAFLSLWRGKRDHPQHAGMQHVMLLVTLNFKVIIRTIFMTSVTSHWLYLSLPTVWDMHKIFLYWIYDKMNGGWTDWVFG